jgi:hypothetical protein
VITDILGQDDKELKELYSQSLKKKINEIDEDYQIELIRSLEKLEIDENLVNIMINSSKKCAK